MIYKGENFLAFLGTYWNNILFDNQTLKDLMDAAGTKTADLYLDLIEASLTPYLQKIPEYRKQNWIFIIFKGDDIIEKPGMVPEYNEWWVKSGDIAHIKYILDKILKPDIQLTYGTDYIIEDGYIKFKIDPSTILNKKYDEEGNVYYYGWGYKGEYYNRDLLTLWGTLVNVFDFSVVNTKNFIYAAAYLSVNGPTIKGIKSILSAALGFPVVINNKEVITDILKVGEKTVDGVVYEDYIIFTDKESYVVEEVKQGYLRQDISVGATVEWGDIFVDIVKVYDSSWPLRSTTCGYYGSGSSVTVKLDNTISTDPRLREPNREIVLPACINDDRIGLLDKIGADFTGRIVGPDSIPLDLDDVTAFLDNYADHIIIVTIPPEYIEKLISPISLLILNKPTWSYILFISPIDISDNIEVTDNIHITEWERHNEVLPESEDDWSEGGIRIGDKVYLVQTTRTYNYIPTGYFFPWGMKRGIPVKAEFVNPEKKPIFASDVAVVDNINIDKLSDGITLYYPVNDLENVVGLHSSVVGIFSEISGDTLSIIFAEYKHLKEGSGEYTEVRAQHTISDATITYPTTRRSAAFDVNPYQAGRRVVSAVVANVTTSTSSNLVLFLSSYDPLTSSAAGANHISIENWGLIAPDDITAKVDLSIQYDGSGCAAIYYSYTDGTQYYSKVALVFFTVQSSNIVINSVYHLSDYDGLGQIGDASIIFDKIYNNGTDPRYIVVLSTDLGQINALSFSASGSIYGTASYNLSDNNITTIKLLSKYCDLESDTTYASGILILEDGTKCNFYVTYPDGEDCIFYLSSAYRPLIGERSTNGYKEFIGDIKNHIDLVYTSRVFYSDSTYTSYVSIHDKNGNLYYYFKFNNNNNYYPLFACYTSSDKMFYVIYKDNSNNAYYFKKAAITDDKVYKISVPFSEFSSNKKYVLKSAYIRDGIGYYPTINDGSLCSSKINTDDGIVDLTKIQTGKDNGIYSFIDIRRPTAPTNCYFATNASSILNNKIYSYGIGRHNGLLVLPIAYRNGTYVYMDFIGTTWNEHLGQVRFTSIENSQSTDIPPLPHVVNLTNNKYVSYFGIYNNGRYYGARVDVNDLSNIASNCSATPNSNIVTYSIFQQACSSKNGNEVIVAKNDYTARGETIKLLRFTVNDTTPFLYNTYQSVTIPGANIGGTSEIRIVYHPTRKKYGILIYEGSPTRILRFIEIDESFSILNSVAINNIYLMYSTPQPPSPPYIWGMAIVPNEAFDDYSIIFNTTDGHTYLYPKIINYPSGRIDVGFTVTNLAVYDAKYNVATNSLTAMFKAGSTYFCLGARFLGDYMGGSSVNVATIIQQSSSDYGFLGDFIDNGYTLFMTKWGGSSPAVSNMFLQKINNQWDQY
jgi:hypothetical protein